jgi:hypothetical protein
LPIQAAVAACAFASGESGQKIELKSSFVFFCARRV